MEDVAELKSKVKHFRFEANSGYSRLLIQLFGYLGHGKSSFINTCRYVLEDGEFINYTQANSDRGGHTTERISYPLTETITLVDNRGCSTMDGYETGEIYAQLANLLPLDKPVEWSKGDMLAERIRQAEPDVQSSDFIFPIFVHSVRMSIVSEDLHQFRDLLKTARDLTGIFPIVVLTYKTRGDVAVKERIFRDLGVERVFAFENYTPSDHIKTRGRHKDVLRFLHELITDVKFRVSQARNPEKEMMDRKILVLKHIKNRDNEEHRVSQEQRGTNGEQRVEPGTTEEQRAEPGTTGEQRVEPGTIGEHRAEPGTTEEQRVEPGTTEEQRDKDKEVKQCSNEPKPQSSKMTNLQQNEQQKPNNTRQRATWPETKTEHRESNIYNDIRNREETFWEPKTPDKKGKRGKGRRGNSCKSQ